MSSAINKVKINKVKIIKSELINCPHGFSTRLSGYSTGIYESLNLGMNRGDNKDNVIKNWDIFLETCNIHEKKFVCGSQIHSNKINIVTKNDARFPYEKYSEKYISDINNNSNNINCNNSNNINIINSNNSNNINNINSINLNKLNLINTDNDFTTIHLSQDNLIEADGYVTGESNLPIAIFTADCTPLLMQDSVNNVIAAVHCGWRSTALDIMKNAVDAMTFIGADRSKIKAAIGPAICFNCFEVGREVIESMIKLLNYDASEFYIKKDNGKYMLNLKAVIIKRLIQLGLSENNIDNLNECTMCQPNKYWSHRITGMNRGSQANVIMLN